MDQKKTGQFLKTLRKEKQITQEALAEILHVSNRTVSRWETGSNMPDISLLVELAEFYDRKGYSKISHSRMARYEILREFISEKDWADPVYDQCMIFDLYARERLKSRPAFAADRSPYKEQLREYEKIYGKQVHIEIFTRDSQPVFVLFDYARRNPLTNDAHVEVLG